MVCLAYGWCGQLGGGSQLFPAGLGGGGQERVGRAQNMKPNSWLGREAGMGEYTGGGAVKVAG